MKGNARQLENGVWSGQGYATCGGHPADDAGSGGEPEGRCQRMKYLITFIQKGNTREVRLIKEGTDKLVRWIRKYADGCRVVRILTVEEG